MDRAAGQPAPPGMGGSLPRNDGFTIEHIEAVPVAVPRARPARSALGLQRSTRAVVVKVRLRNGVTGLGEVSMVFNGGAGVLERVLEERLIPAVLGENAASLTRIHQRMAAAYQFSRAANAAKAAVEMAVLDALGKSLGLPVYQLLGGAVRDRIPLSMSVHMDAVPEMVAQAEAFVAQGFKTVKVKVGVDPEADVQVVQAIREAIGPDINLRVDANMGWRTAREAEAMIRRLAPAGIHSVEQPLAPGRLDDLAALRQRVDVPIMVDESVWGPGDAWEVVKRGAADIINVYVSEAGGLLPAMQIFQLAELAGIEACIGSMPELGIGTAAQAHLGVAVPFLRCPSDVAGVLYHADDVIQEKIPIADGYARPPAGPGLGVTLDEGKLEAYRIGR